MERIEFEAIVSILDELIDQVGEKLCVKIR